LAKEFNMPEDAIHVDAEQRRHEEAERDRVRLLAHGALERAPDVFPQPVEQVMAIRDAGARHEAALRHMRILCRTIRAKEGVQDLKTGRGRLSQKASDTLEASMSVFRRTHVLSESELDAMLVSGETEGDRQTA
jgi:hypothetical protein